MVKYDLLYIFRKQGFHRLCPTSKVAKDLKNDHD